MANHNSFQEEAVKWLKSKDGRHTFSEPCSFTIKRENNLSEILTFVCSGEKQKDGKLVVAGDTTDWRVKIEGVELNVVLIEKTGKLALLRSLTDVAVGYFMMRETPESANADFFPVFITSRPYSEEELATPIITASQSEQKLLLSEVGLHSATITERLEKATKNGVAARMYFQVHNMKRPVCLLDVKKVPDEEQSILVYLGTEEGTNKKARLEVREGKTVLFLG